MEFPGLGTDRRDKGSRPGYLSASPANPQSSASLVHVHGRKPDGPGFRSGPCHTQAA